MEIADVDAALKKVHEFLAALNHSEHLWRTGQDSEESESARAEAEIRQQIPFIRELATRVDPSLAERLRAGSLSSYPNWPFYPWLDAAQELAGTLASAEGTERILGPAGPRLAAAQLHPWVWNPAVNLWADGHRREAVQAAATAIFDHHLPAKLGIPRGKSAKDLASQAFSTNPPVPGQPRLRLPDYLQGTPDWTSQHEGAGFLGMGCAQVIRNLTTHGAQPDEQTALEQLATLSLLARLIDKAQRVV